MTRPPLRFRIKLGGALFLRVHVAETREAMWRTLQKLHGEKHRHEYAATITPCVPERGCVADLCFYWRGLRPAIIAHEASHAADAVLSATPPGPRADAEEHRAAVVEKIVERIWLKTQAAPL